MDRRRESGDRRLDRGGVDRRVHAEDHAPAGFESQTRSKGHFLAEQASNPGWAERRVREELTGALERALTRPPDEAVAPAASAAGLPPQARPITFNAAMVRAILAGNKTQTRRPIKPPPAGATMRGRRLAPVDDQGRHIECRLARSGEILWVREPWLQAGTSRGKPRIEYEADLGPAAAEQRKPWRPGRYLPRDSSRLELEVRRVYAQRLGELSPQDAIAEGISPPLLEDDPAGAIEEFRKLWDAFYGLTDFAWENNRWVWVVRFKSVEPKEDDQFVRR